MPRQLCLPGGTIRKPWIPLADKNYTTEIKLVATNNCQRWENLKEQLILRKLNEFQENAEKWFNTIPEKLNRGIKGTFKSQIKILELKSTLSKNEIKGINSRVDETVQKESVDLKVGCLKIYKQIKTIMKKNIHTKFGTALREVIFQVLGFNRDLKCYRYGKFNQTFIK